MYGNRFYGGWLLSALFMYLAFYVFHGIITNDLLKLAISKSLFLSVAAVVYLIVGLGMSVLYRSTSLKKNIRNPYTRGLVIGVLTALFLYAVAFTVGISAANKVTLLNILVDVSWQLVEQCFGMFFILLANLLFYHVEEEHANYL